MAASKPPQLSPRAAKFWADIPLETKNLLIANVYCSHCRGAVSIVNFTGAVKSGDLVLNGSCAVCGNNVARVIEGPDA